jgi:hypothetical protein
MGRVRIFTGFPRVVEDKRIVAIPFNLFVSALYFIRLYR